MDPTNAAREDGAVDDGLRAEIAVILSAVLSGLVTSQTSTEELLAKLWQVATRLLVLRESEALKQWVASTREDLAEQPKGGA